MFYKPLSLFLFTDCNSSDTEIIILVNKPFYTSHQDIVEHFAKQFYNLNNIVRILSYEARRPLVAFSLNKVQLEINDKQLQPDDVVKRLEECQYKILAESFIPSLRFTKTATNALVFLDTNVETNDLANEIFGKKFSSSQNSDLVIYRIREEPNIIKTIRKDSSVIRDVFIRRWKELSAIGAGYFSKICEGNPLNPQISVISYISDVVIPFKMHE
jgi:hypothetical protein